MFREASLTTYLNIDLIDCQTGNAGSVEFDFDRIWGYLKNLEFFSTTGLVMYHTHPQGMLEYSTFDEKVFKGYTKALGGSPLFCILYFNNSEIFDLSNQYQFYQVNENMKICLYEEWIPVPNQILSILKFLSYRGFEGGKK